MIVRVFIEARGKMHRFPFNSNLFQFFLGVERVASGGRWEGRQNGGKFLTALDLTVWLELKN